MSRKPVASMHIYTQEEFPNQETPCQIVYRLRLEVRGKRLETALELAILESRRREGGRMVYGKDRKTGPDWAAWTIRPQGKRSLTAREMKSRRGWVRKSRMGSRWPLWVLARQDSVLRTRRRQTTTGGLVGVSRD